MAKVQDGAMIRVENKGAHRLANKTYIAVHVTDDDGDNEECLLFTDSEIRRARERAHKNPEDIPQKHWLTDFLDGD